MSTYDMLIQKGIKKGIKALLKRGEDVKTIAEIFEVPIEMVERIKNEMLANGEL